MLIIKASELKVGDVFYYSDMYCVLRSKGRTTDLGGREYFTAKRIVGPTVSRVALFDGYFFLPIDNFVWLCGNG